MGVLGLGEDQRINFANNNVELLIRIKVEISTRLLNIQFWNSADK